MLWHLTNTNTHCNDVRNTIERKNDIMKQKLTGSQVWQIIVRTRKGKKYLIEKNKYRNKSYCSNKLRGYLINIGLSVLWQRWVGSTYGKIAYIKSFFSYYVYFIKSCNSVWWIYQSKIFFFVTWSYVVIVWSQSALWQNVLFKLTVYSLFCPEWHVL